MRAGAHILNIIKLLTDDNQSLMRNKMKVNEESPNLTGSRKPL